MLLIDEPEISLSINYQSKIITDLVELGNKKIITIYKYCIHSKKRHKKFDSKLTARSPLTIKNIKVLLLFIIINF